MLATTRTKTEKMEELIATMDAIASRPGYCAEVAVIDKVPPSLDENAVSKLAALIQKHLKVKAVLQDRLHVGMNMSKQFNNCDSRFHRLIILGWREATVVRDSKCEGLVDEMLLAGKISKKRGDAQVSEGVPLSKEAISELKETGKYHDLFSATDVVVPENVMTADALRLSTARWAQNIIDECFHPPDEQGVRQPIYIAGKKLIPTPELVWSIRTKALKRILNCIPPEGSEPWSLNGKLDHNDLPISKPNFHTCGNESWNATQGNYMAKGTCIKQLVTGCHLLGNAKRIVSNKVKWGEQEELGTWDVRPSQRINRWAGHGSDANMIQLTPQPPLSTKPLLDVAPGEVAIHSIERLDDVRKGCRLVPTERVLHSQPGAPTVKGLLPPATLLSLPSLASISSGPAAPLLLRSSDNELVDNPAQLDPAQLDSPQSRALLLSHGIGDPKTAPQGMLQRAWTFASSLFSSDSSSSSTGASSESSPPPAALDAEGADAVQSVIRRNFLEDINALTPTPPRGLAAAAQEKLISPRGPALPPVVPPTTASVPIASAPSFASAPVLAAPLPQGSKRKMVGESKVQANKRSRSNPWWCICLSRWPSAGGRAWHESACPRKLWIESDGSYVPELGTRVTCLTCAGARAGQVWECTSAAKGSWKQVV